MTTKDWQSLTRMGRFVSVGATATATQFLILTTLIELGLTSAVVASATGYALSAVLNYALNHRFTFRSDAAHLSAAPKFVAMAASGLALNTVLFALFYRIGLGYLASQTLTVIGVLAFNYTVASRWVFAGSADRLKESS